MTRFTAPKQRIARRCALVAALWALAGTSIGACADRFTAPAEQAAPVKTRQVETGRVDTAEAQVMLSAADGTTLSALNPADAQFASVPSSAKSCVVDRDGAFPAEELAPGLWKGARFSLSGSNGISFTTGALDASGNGTLTRAKATTYEVQRPGPANVMFLYSIGRASIDKVTKARWDGQQLTIRDLLISYELRRQPAGKPMERGQYRSRVTVTLKPAKSSAERGVMSFSITNTTGKPNQKLPPLKNGTLMRANMAPDVISCR